MHFFWVEFMCLQVRQATFKDMHARYWEGSSVAFKALAVLWI